MEDVRREILNNVPNFQFYHSSKGSSTTPEGSERLADSINLDAAVMNCSSGPEPKDVADSIKVVDTLSYIYTSGTTGLPKAVNISHLR